MMGHSVDTLRRIYERCTPSEKQQIIEDAINRKLCNSLTDIDSDKVYTVEQLMHFVMKLSRQDVWAFFGQLYKSLLGKHFDGQGA
jgi:hypothetical protein